MMRPLAVIESRHLIVILVIFILIVKQGIWGQWSMGSVGTDDNGLVALDELFLTADVHRAVHRVDNVHGAGLGGAAVVVDIFVGALATVSFVRLILIK